MLSVPFSPSFSGLVFVSAHELFINEGCWRFAVIAVVTKHDPFVAVGPLNQDTSLHSISVWLHICHRKENTL